MKLVKLTDSNGSTIAVNLGAVQQVTPRDAYYPQNGSIIRLVTGATVTVRESVDTVLDLFD